MQTECTLQGALRYADEERAPRISCSTPCSTILPRRNAVLPEFDPRTLVFVSSLMALLCSTILFLQRRSFPTDVGGLSYWAGGCVAEVFASGLFGMRGFLPELFTVVVPNCLLVGGFMLIYVGVRDFYGKTAN